MTQKNICIVALGYAGLSLAVSFAEKFQVVAFDINQSRINELYKQVITAGTYLASSIKVAEASPCVRIHVRSVI
jgi:UDP-glucose 6-dehydrogenase